MTDPTEPPSTEPTPVVLLRFAQPLPLDLFADLCAAIDETLRLHGWTGSRLTPDDEGPGALAATPPASGRHRTEEGESSG